MSSRNVKTITHPLTFPQDSQLWLEFARHFRIAAGAPTPETLVASIARAFARIPYENLTKIIQNAEMRRADRARRGPEEVLRQHYAWRTGGTCFALTAALLHLVRSVGVTAEPILADRPYGQNTHSALLVWIDHQPHLVDPGFLIVDPVSLADSQPRTIHTGFSVLELGAEEHGKRELATIGGDKRRPRLTYKLSPADPGEFLRAWDASFDWEMMHYPLITQVTGSRQFYLRGGYFQQRQIEQIERFEVPSEQLASHIHETFGIDANVIRKALSVLDRSRR